MINGTGKYRRQCDHRQWSGECSRRWRRGRYTNRRAGNDSFKFNFHEADGDTITDFTGAGATVGDHLDFYGYGTIATGATVKEVGTTDFYKITPDTAHGGAAAAETIPSMCSI